MVITSWRSGVDIVQSVLCIWRDEGLGGEGVDEIVESMVDY